MVAYKNVVIIAFSLSQNKLQNFEDITIDQVIKISLSLIFKFKKRIKKKIAMGKMYLNINFYFWLSV